MSPTDVAPAIELRGLVKRYGDTVAVDGLDLTVHRGETLALLGPNGAGKTTTVECCEGYRRPDRGVVRVLGLDPVADADRLRSRVGVMLQEDGVYATAHPREALRLFAAFYADPLDPDRLLERVGLASAARTRYRDLSGGEKRRLSLALALVGRPQLVFLDEPTAGLDPAARRRTWRHVAELRARGVTIVLTTHLLDEAEELADRVAILDRGRLVALGTPEELTRGSRRQLRFTGASGLDVGRLAARLGVEVDEERPGRYVVHAEAAPDLVAEVTRWMADHGLELRELQAGGDTLEDVFLRLTSERSVAAVRASGGPRERPPDRPDRDHPDRDHPDDEGGGGMWYGQDATGVGRGSGGSRS